MLLAVDAFKCDLRSLFALSLSNPTNSPSIIALGVLRSSCGQGGGGSLLNRSCSIDFISVPVMACLLLVAGLEFIEGEALDFASVDFDFDALPTMGWFFDRDVCTSFPLNSVT